MYVFTTAQNTHNRQAAAGVQLPPSWRTFFEYWRWMKPKTYLFPGTVKN
jgi:hypothetical protein